VNDPVESLTEPSKVAIVTGASSGIGQAAAEELARRGFAVTLVGRDETRLAQAVQRVRALTSQPVEGHRCDFARLDDVRALAKTLAAAHPHIDVLANNAGGVVRNRSTTADGYESTIQTNHLAGFLLSVLLRENLRGGRIVNTASRVHTTGRLDPDDLNAERSSYSAMGRYGDAKEANVLFAAEAARRWPDIRSSSFHPGVVRTRFGNDNPVFRFFYTFAPGLRSPAKGAETLVWLATTDGTRNGGYFFNCKETRPAARAVDPDTAARLWEASLTAVSQ
jgi:NAD(P)-dependent dehydrogenase (short-subunit alcohol dehydrogenase family)